MKRQRTGRSRLKLTALVALLCVQSISSSDAQAPLQPAFVQALVGDVGGRSRAWGLAIADFTGDGIPDIIAGDTFGDVRVLVGNGLGTFQDHGVVINMPFWDALALAAADFDRDGFQDFVLARTGGGSITANDGEVLLYRGNGDGSFQSTGPAGLQVGVLVGDAGTDPVALAVADVDGDGDMDIVAGERSTSSADPADIVLFRNQLEIAGGALTWTPETIVSGTDRGFSPVPEDPPYFPPDGFLEGYGLALGDVDGDGDPDLMLSDQANYFYVYKNDGSGVFTPVRYDTIATRPFAFARLHVNFTFQMPLMAGDLNSDGLVDFATAVQTGNGSGSQRFPVEVEVWLGEGPDGAGRPSFVGGGIVSQPGSGTDARGLAIGQLDPGIDLAADIAFGNAEGDIYALFADLEDSDGDGIVDSFDNAPLVFNPPIVDMNTDGAINRLDQLDNDNDGMGDPVDEDDDEDGVDDLADNCPFTANSGLEDGDGDGLGDACDPLNDLDTDLDGVFDGPFDWDLAAKALDAKAQWARSDTHFIIRVDALSRAFQNEFTQTFADAAVLSPEEWELKKFDNYNDIGDAPADPGYQVPLDLPGGIDVPITLEVIPKQIWNAFGDPDPVWWINDRNGNRNLEIGQHGTYHANNTPLGDWADMPDRNFFSCETCGLPLEAVYQLLRVGERTLLGQYEVDPWIRQSGADPATSPRIDWSDATNPLISFAPPFNTSDTEARAAVAELPMRAFSASIFEEERPVFTPEGSHQETFDQFGMFHASAHRQIDPEDVPELDAITNWGGLNVWLIEEVEWSTRYCNDLDRLEPCAEAPGGVNRENNMVDELRWDLWLQLLEFAKSNGEVMTMGDYALAMATDNCPAIPNGTQTDLDADGYGDVCDVDRIDVMPGNPVNPIAVGSNAVVAVAILGNADLDVANVDVTSLEFGPAAALPKDDLTDPKVLARHLRDVDRDGFVDLVSHYRVRETGIVAADQMACLGGVIGASPFEACDVVATRPASARAF